MYCLLKKLYLQYEDGIFFNFIFIYLFFLQALIHDKLIPKWKGDLTRAFEMELQHQKVLFNKYGMNCLLPTVILVIYLPNTLLDFHQTGIDLIQ